MRAMQPVMFPTSVPLHASAVVLIPDSMLAVRQRGRPSGSVKGV